jgi:hypothetical protein
MLRLGRVDIWYAQPSGFTRSDGETDIDRSACTLCFDDYLSCMQHMAFGRPLLLLIHDHSYAVNSIASWTVVCRSGRGTCQLLHF